MTIQHTSLWDLHRAGYWAVIPTNLQHSRGRAHMGAGLAKDAASRFPGLAERYGTALEEGAAFLPCNEERLLLVPTKKHWREPSTLNQVLVAVTMLDIWASLNPTARVAVPALGCGLGGLEWRDVRPVLARLGEQFVVCVPEEWEHE